MASSSQLILAGRVLVVLLLALAGGQDAAAAARRFKPSSPALCSHRAQHGQHARRFQQRRAPTSSSAGEWTHGCVAAQWTHGCVAAQLFLSETTVDAFGRVETISWSPRAFIYHSFLTHAEADWIVKLAEAKVRTRMLALQQAAAWSGTPTCLHACTRHTR